MPIAFILYLPSCPGVLPASAVAKPDVQLLTQDITKMQGEQRGEGEGQLGSHQDKEEQKSRAYLRLSGAQLPQDEQQSLWTQRSMPAASEQTAIVLYLKLNPGFRGGPHGLSVVGGWKTWNSRAKARGEPWVFLLFSVLWPLPLKGKCLILGMSSRSYRH